MTKQQKYGILLAWLSKSTVFHSDRLRDETVQFMFDNWDRLNYCDPFELQKELLSLYLEMKAWGVEYPIKTLKDCDYVRQLIRAKKSGIFTQGS